MDATWRFLEAGSTRVNGGYTITWTNNTNSDITVNYRLVFSDASGIQLGEDNPFDDFDLDAGENRKRTGNFDFTASVARANQVKSMDIWAGFTER